jgi:hypothetical protein
MRDLGIIAGAIGAALYLIRFRFGPAEAISGGSETLF